MMKIAAVDDERHVLERFERMVSGNADLELCGLFETGEELLSYIKDNPLDAVFLDIEMPGESGLILSAKIQDINDHIDIVFVTAFNQYAVEAFDMQAVDYLMKPLAEGRLEKTISRLIRNKRAFGNSGKPYTQCAGGFEVYVNGEALTWKNTKAKEIFAFLIYKQGVPVNWEKIADAVWPDYDGEKAQTNFHATTYLLRKRLAEAGISAILENARGNYRVVSEQVDCDFWQLEERIHNNQMKRKEDMLLLEHFLERGYMEDCGYEWVQERTAEVERMCRALLDTLKK